MAEESKSCNMYHNTNIKSFKEKKTVLQLLVIKTLWNMKTLNTDSDMS